MNFEISWQWAVEPISWINSWWNHNFRILCVVVAGFVIFRCLVFAYEVTTFKQACRFVGLGFVCFGVILRQLADTHAPVTWAFLIFLFGLIVAAVGLAGRNDTSIPRRRNGST